MRLKISLAVISLLWVRLIAVSFFWNYTSAQNEQERIASQTARSFFDLVVMTRLMEW